MMIVLCFPLFPLGRTLATPAALETLARLNMDPAMLLARHASGDWGDTSPNRRVLNERALVTGARILSAYKLSEQDTLWIITTGGDDCGQRDATTLLLPSEY